MPQVAVVLHKGGYPAHIGKKQLGWLKRQLKTLNGPILVICHQPLAGPSSIDNAKAVQSLLDAAADKVVLAVNGHSQLDRIPRAGGTHVDDLLQHGPDALQVFFKAANGDCQCGVPSAHNASADRRIKHMNSPLLSDPRDFTHEGWWVGARAQMLT